MQVDIELLKCALIVGIIFFVLSHPYLYRFMHKYLRGFMAFVDERMCPTEGGVLVHAVLFVLIVYFGKQAYMKYGPESKKNKKNKNNNNGINNNAARLANNLPENNIPGKCRVYCEKISNDLAKKNNKMLNNKIVQNNLNNANNMGNNMPMNNANNMGNNMPMNNANNMGNNMQMNNANNMINNANNMINNANNMPMNNVNMISNNNNLNNINNNLNNVAYDANDLNGLGNRNDIMVANNPVANNNLPTNNMMGNNASFEDMMLASATNNANNNLDNNSGLGCSSLSDFTNQINQGNMFQDNTTYVDDMYASVF